MLNPDVDWENCIILFNELNYVEIESWGGVRYVLGEYLKDMKSENKVKIKEKMRDSNKLEPNSFHNGWVQIDTLRLYKQPSRR
jgi:hypothetical protein